MALQYPSEWKFEGVGFSISDEAYNNLYDLILKVSTGAEEPQWVIEKFKSGFGAIGSSSSFDWAITDLSSVMLGARTNAAAFIDAYWSTMEAIKEYGIAVPSVNHINDVLHQHDVPLTISPPHLVLEGVDSILMDEGDAGTSNSYAASNYRLGEKLGEGGYGVVYRAKRVTAVAEFEFALKILDPSAFIRDREKALARFQREVYALRQLQHRAIVPYLDAGLSVEGKPYLVMPLIEGKDMRSATEGMELRRVLHLFTEVLEGLRFAHIKGVLHRDLKPSNILVRESDTQPVILDFGCAYLRDEAGLASLTTTAVGSQGYIPSEVIAEPTLRTPQHDIFSCGIILYEMLARRQPDPREYQSLTLMDHSFAMVDSVVQRAIAPATSRFTTVDDLLDAAQDCYKKCE
jgi:hypothetical protein